MDKASKIRLFILAVLFLAASISVYASLREDRRGVLTVAFLNVGQGDAIFIEAPDGDQVLIDAGPDKSILRELSGVMPFYDRSIDVALITHADQDHAGGMPDVLKGYSAGAFIEPGVPGESASYQEVESIVSEKESRGEIKKILARRGMEVDLGEGAMLSILFPDREAEGIDSNVSSIVARLTYGDSEFLFTGDSPLSVEEYLASLGGIKSDVLKVGHHGSKTSTDAAFVAAVSPQYAVISVGKDNRYGHPDKEVLDILNDFGAKILRTDEAGRIIFKTDGQKLRLK